MRKLQSMLPWERKERLILLSHEALRWPDNGPLQHVTLPDLAPDEVANFLAQREKKDAGVQLGQLFVGLCRQSSVEGPVEGALGDFEKQPGTLAQLCELALHSNEVLSPPLPFTPYVTTETKSPVQLLQMRARRRVPKYGLLDLLSSALFNRHIVLTCDPDFDLRRSIKRELPGEDSTSKRYPCIEAEALEGALAVAKSEIESSAEMLRQVIRARLLPKDQGNGAAVLVIFDPRNSLPSCSEAARAEVMSLSDRLILVPGASSDWSREETVLVLHCESDEPLLFVPVSESMAPLPPTGKWHTRQSASDVICAIRHGFQAQVESVLVVSESGGGKSSVLKMLHRECAVTARPDSAIRLEHGVERVSWPWAGRFSNVVALTFRQLLTEAGRTSVGSTNLSCEVPMDNLGKVLLQFMCVTNPVLRRVFIADLKARRVILLLDSWDELPMRSGKSDPFVASVLFATGQCPVVVTTKTIHDVVQADGLDSLFKKGFDLVLSLDLFNDAQISEYVYGCFASTGALVDSGLASRRNEFCQQLCHHIKSSSATMPTLGLPLQCFLMCEAYWPIFKNLDHGGIPEPLHILPRVKLYRGFLGCRLRKRLITRFSAEYLAAIHLAAMLVSDRSNAELVIQKYRYQSRFMTTFEFLAGVVSYGDPFAPFNQAALTLFWSALLREPVDLAGAAASALVIGCYRQSCSHQMGKLFPGILPSVTGLEITAAEVTPEPDVGSIESSAAGVAISTANYLRFNPPGHIWKYHEMVDAIMALPIERLRHPTEVARARKWLVAKMTGTQSYRVASACADRLAKLGWATSKADTVRVMLKAVVGAAQRWCGKDLRTTCEVLTSAIAIDPDFAKLTAVRYATPLPVEALIKTVIDYSACDVPISAELLEWTARQPIFAAQPGKILARIGCGNRCRPLDLLELCRSHVNGDDAHFDALLAESVQEPPSNTMAGKMARLVMLFSLHLRHDNSACPDTGANWLLRFEDEICQRQFPDLYKTKLSFEDQERLSRIIQLAKRAIHLRGLDSRLVGLMRSLLFSCLDKPHLKNLAVSVIRVNLDLRTCNGEQLSRVKRLLFGRFDSNERWDPGFWNADVVEPSLKLFVPHWDMLIAEYVVLRIRGVWRPPTLGMLLGGEFVTRFSNFSNEKLKSLVWMCLHVHRHLQDQSSGTTSSWNNPIFYLGSVPIAEACQFLSSLSSNAPTLTTTTESHICQFLLEFLRSRQTALCVEEGRAFVYSANERVELPCESKTFVRSLVEAAQNLESTAAATRPLLGPANVPRVAAASLSRSTYVIAWQPAYPPSVPPDDFSERPSLDAVFTTDSGT
ncbi:hypothetical protein BDZ88DRAFT_431466 [Geranomyces variabilis]|nr:hypothetical protein BDZ88DRAFT_431466 [Geranomyces variabilis]